MTSIPRPFRWTTSTGCSHPSAVAAKLRRISPIPAITQACRKLTMKLRVCRVDQTCDFFLTEYPWEVTHLLRIRRLGDAPVALQHVDIEEPQRRQPHNYGVRTVL